MSCDPLGHEATPDLYAYADGDPINNIDPDGRFANDAYNEIKSTINNVVDYYSHPPSYGWEDAKRDINALGPLGVEIAGTGKFAAQALNALNNLRTVVDLSEGTTGRTSEAADRGVLRGSHNSASSEHTAGSYRPIEVCLVINMAIQPQTV